MKETKIEFPYVVYDKDWKVYNIEDDITVSSVKRKLIAVDTVLYAIFSILIASSIVLMCFAIDSFRKHDAILGLILSCWSVIVIAGSIFAILVIALPEGTFNFVNYKQ